MPAATLQRVGSLDVLRGLVIVLMALDHVRGFVAPAGMNPTNWETTTFAFFLVRWVTHLCAPTFVFLMGVGAALRYRSKPDDTRTFLLKRGVWLIALEVTWVSFSWSWDISKTNLGVLWSIGGSMMLLAPFVALRARSIAIMGALMVVGLEVLNFQPEFGPVRILFQPTSMNVFGHSVGGAYVLLPWFGVASLGWGLAPWLVGASRPQLARAGWMMLAAFASYRSLQWTDPDGWAQQGRWDMTVADFLNPSKYPPSICFVLLTLGAAVVLLAGPARRMGRAAQMLQTFGRVPMFFYLVHLPMAHLLGNGYAWVVYGSSRVPSTEPLSIATILISWLGLVFLLWPVCVRWDALKRARRDLKWLRYL